MYGIYRKILDSHQGDFQILVKSDMFQKKFKGSFQGDSLKNREGSHVGTSDVTRTSGEHSPSSRARI